MTLNQVSLITSRSAQNGINQFLSSGITIKQLSDFIVIECVWGYLLYRLLRGVHTYRSCVVSEDGKMGFCTLYGPRPSKKPLRPCQFELSTSRRQTAKSLVPLRD